MEKITYKLNDTEDTTIEKWVSNDIAWAIYHILDEAKDVSKEPNNR